MTMNAGRTAALRTLGLEKYASGWMDFVNYFPDMMQQAPDMLAQLKANVAPFMSHAGQALHGFLPSIGAKAAPILAEGAALHGTANQAMRYARHTPTGLKFEKNLAAMGIRHGMEGKQISPIIKYPVTGIVGPELAAAYDAGRAIGGPLQSATEAQRNRVLNAARGVVSDPAIAKSPVGYLADSMSQAMGPQKDSLLRRLGSPFLVNGEASKLEHGLGLAATAGLSQLDPTGILPTHMTINAGRSVIGNSSLGKDMLRDGLVKGLAGLNPSASPGMEMVTDLALSPAVLDPQRIGYAVHDAMKNRPKETAANVGEFAQAFADLPSVRGPVKEQLNNLNQYVTDKAQQAVAAGKEHVSAAVGAAKDAIPKAVDAGKQFVGNQWRSMLADPGLRRKAMIGAGALGAGALGYGAYRMFANRKKEREQQAQRQAAAAAQQQQVSDAQLLAAMKAFMAQQQGASAR